MKATLVIVALALVTLSALSGGITGAKSIQSHIGKDRMVEAAALK